jgi:endoglucanase
VAVRLPVSSAIWRRDGQSYLDRVGAMVRAANDQRLIVVLSDFEDAASGNPSSAGLPMQETLSFWTAWAAYFKDSPFVIFDILNEPSANDVPGHLAGQRLPSDWRFWLNGGTGLDGRTLVGMQALVNAIRSTGATQLIAASAFHDNLDFQGFTSDFLVRDPNVIYEVHPFFDHALTDADRDRNFGFLVRSVPVYAGAWGLELTQDSVACRSIPANPQQVTDLLFQALAYFDGHAIAWTTVSLDHSVIRA